MTVLEETATEGAEDEIEGDCLEGDHELHISKEYNISFAHKHLVQAERDMFRTIFDIYLKK